MSGSAKQKLVVIQGPTGVGKTSVALELCAAVPVEIVNADSMQFYRAMDIGTSKPSHDELRAAPHHLFSIIDPDKEFNAALFMQKGRSVIGDILARGNTPVIVGGTGLYVKALLQGLFNGPGKDYALRHKLDSYSTDELRAQLKDIDAEAFSRIRPHDRMRIIRALEVFYVTGVPMTEQQRRHDFQDRPYESLRICLWRERQSLYRRINERVDRMMESGFADEVRWLLDHGYSADLKSMQSIGYRQMVEYIQGQLGEREALVKIQQETRRLAKRQLTWLRGDHELEWVQLPDQEKCIIDMVKNFLNNA